MALVGVYTACSAVWSVVVVPLWLEGLSTQETAKARTPQASS